MLLYNCAAAGLREDAEDHAVGMMTSLGCLNLLKACLPTSCHAPTGAGLTAALT